MLNDLRKQYPYWYYLTHAMVQLYQENDTDEVLSAMLRHLIRGQQAGRRYYPYFRLGIERHLKITQLYEYFFNDFDNIL